MPLPCPPATNIVDVSFDAGGGTQTTFASWSIVCGAGVNPAAVDGRWLRVDPLFGTHSIYVVVIHAEPNVGLAREATVSAGYTLIRVHQAAHAGATDADADGLEDGWEVELGLRRAGAHGALDDPDHDGLTNLEEQANETHPLGTSARFFADGLTNTFFSSELAIAATDTTHVLVRAIADRRLLTRRLQVAPLTPTVVNLADWLGPESREFGLVVEADRPVGVERQMSWDARQYGSHADTGAAHLATTWHFAEGASHSGFQLFYTFMNPNITGVATIRCRFLSHDGPGRVLDLTLGAESRRTLWINQFVGLDAGNLGVIVESSAPIAVDRAMYLSGAGRTFNAGHGGSGASAPALEWRFEEGATGGYFDTFLALANPNATAADVLVTYAPRFADGTGRVTPASSLAWVYTLPPLSRRTIWVDRETFGSGGLPLADVPVSMTVRSTNGVPIAAERAMWWPGPSAATWSESHVSAGATGTAPAWIVPRGESGGNSGSATYLFAEVLPMTTADDALVIDVLFEDGTSRGRIYTLEAGGSRFVFDIGALFPETAGRRYAVRVASAAWLADPASSSAARLIVEYTRYSNGDGETWANGVNAPGVALAAITPLP